LITRLSRNSDLFILFGRQLYVELWPAFLLTLAHPENITGAVTVTSFRFLRFIAILGLALGALGLLGGPSLQAAEKPAKTKNKVEHHIPVVINPDPYPSTYKPLPSKPTLITHATILTGDGQQLEDADILLEDNVIKAMGKDLTAPAGVTVVDAKGKWVSPGIIDVHSHLGVYPTPSYASTQDGNEMTSPVTADVWAEHSIWPQDSGFSRALAGGVTTLQILPGSANLIGGRGVTIKNVPSRTVQGMKFPGAPYSLKMACGENPKRVYGDRKQAPSTLMGDVAGYRKAWIKASAYRRKWDEYNAKIARGEEAEAPERDLELDTLAEVLRGHILVHTHCYRADEMAVMIDLSHEFGYKIAAFHHAAEAYKIADLLAKEHICAAMWADWWGFKLEAFDGIDENIALVHHAGACAMIHSDSEDGIQRLNQETAKAWAAGNRIGLNISEADAFSWLTLNPAKSLGIADHTGSLAVGKAADVVIWSGNPFSVYTLAEKVFIDGALLFDRDQPDLIPQSDFELGQVRRGDQL
jgi:imidazolonepropionase-like amidohydrolase